MAPSSTAPCPPEKVAQLLFHTITMGRDGNKLSAINPALDKIDSNALKQFAAFA
jgi:hypothetical protein